MVATVGSIDVRLGADLRTLSAQLAKGEKRVGQYASRTEKQLSNVARSFVAGGKAAASFLAPLKGALLASAIGGFLSLGGAIAGAKESLSEFDRIAKAAKFAAIDSDSYQSLAYAAELAGVGVEKLDAGLQQFRRNSALAASEQGTLYTVLKKVNPELLKQLQTSDSQAEKLRLVSDAMKAAKTETDRVAIATAAFGRNGQVLIPILADGSAGLAEMERKARELGIVIDSELLRRSEDLSDQLATASKVADLQFKSALVSLAPVLISTANLAADVASAIGAIADRMRDLDGKTTAGLENRMAELGKERLDVENEILAIRDKQRNITGVLAQAERRLLDGQIAQRQERLDAIAAEEKQILSILDSRNKSPTNPPPPNLPTPPTTCDDNAKAALREAEAVTAIIDALQREQALLGATDAERRVAEELRRAGTAATAEQRDQIVGLVNAITAEEAAIRGSNQAMEARRQTVEFLLSSTVGTLEDIISGADSAGEAFNQLALNIANAAIQAQLFGSGPFASGGGLVSAIFGSLGSGASLSPAASSAISAGIAGPYHGGGDVGGTGNHGEVLALVEEGETVFDSDQTASIKNTLAAATKQAGSGAGGMTNVYKIDARGSEAGVEKKIVAALEEYDRKKAPQTVIETMRKAGKAGVR